MGGKKGERRREETLLRATQVVLSVVAEDHYKLVELASGYVAGVALIALDVERESPVAEQGREALERYYSQFPGLREQIEEFMREDAA